MIRIKKRDRSINFSYEEVEKLVSLVEPRKKVVENKKSDAATWHEKEKIWKEIEVMFNSKECGVHRDAKNLKLKYEALKRDIRKKGARAELYKTGGISTAPILTSIEEKVKNILLSVKGNESINDSEKINYEEAAGVIGTININLEVPNNTEKCLHNDFGPSAEKSCRDEPMSSSSGVDETQPSSSSAGISSVNLQTSLTGNEWLTSPLKSKKDSILCSAKRKRPFGRLAEEKIGLVNLQKKLIEEELQEKVLKKKLIEEELEHKRQIFDLERQERLAKLEILKTQLEKLKKGC